MEFNVLGTWEPSILIRKYWQEATFPQVTKTYWQEDEEGIGGTMPASKLNL